MVEKKPSKPSLNEARQTTLQPESARTAAAKPGRKPAAPVEAAPVEAAAGQAETAGVAAARAPAFDAAALRDFDFSRLFSEMKLPAMPDMEAILATHKRNLEALSDANRLALAGAQAVARRHLEIMQSTMAELTDSVKSLAGTKAPAGRAAKQADLLRQAYENAVSNTRELGDLIQRSNAEAMETLNQRFSEAMNELKTLFGKL